MITQHVMIDGPGGTKPLSAETCVPTGYVAPDRVRTLVIMAHDIPFSHSRDHSDMFGFMRGLFAEHGYTSMIFDYQSCGDSEGREESLSIETARENFARILQWSREAGYERFILVGCGISAALCLEHADKDTKIMFLFWPAIDLKAHSRKTLYENGKISASKGRKISGDLVAQMESYDPSPLMKSLKVPVSIHYGDRDENASPEQIEFIKKNFNALRIDITSYADGGPGLLDPRHRKMVAHHMNSFLEKYA